MDFVGDVYGNEPAKVFSAHLSSKDEAREVLGAVTSKLLWGYEEEIILLGTTFVLSLLSNPGTVSRQSMPERYIRYKGQASAGTPGIWIDCGEWRGGNEWA